MAIDAALLQIIPGLQEIEAPTLWLVDENAFTALNRVYPCPDLLLVTNRFDIYQTAIRQAFRCIFTDFNSKDYPVKAFDKIVYRIAKEKAQVHFLLNQTAQLLTENGELIISGYKSEGIKGYGDRLKKILKASGTMKKNHRVYCGHFRNLDKTTLLDDQDYQTIRTVNPKNEFARGFYSKPGVFGWNKMDKGTGLLLLQARAVFSKRETCDRTLLDLGCGYGQILMTMDEYRFSSITATDNNAAALLCARNNAKTLTTPVRVVAGDCANTITATFDFVLCNPPFHQGFDHRQQLTGKFLLAVKRKIKPDGLGLMVMNEFIGVDNLLEKYRLRHEILQQKDGFKVISIQTPDR